MEGNSREGMAFSFKLSQYLGHNTDGESGLGDLDQAQRWENVESKLVSTGFHECEILGLDFTSVDKHRSRRVVSRSNSRPTIKYPSWKNQRMIHCESKHELNTSILLDADTSVISFREQPCKIKYRSPDGQYIHYPDFLVERHNSRELWEVKADVEKEGDEIIFRTYLLKEKLPNSGYEYRLICGKTISANVSLSNAKFLTRRGRTQFDMDVFEQALNLFSTSNEMRWSEFRLFGDTVRSVTVLARLILEGFVEFDQTRMIDRFTQIRWANKDCSQEA